MEKELQRLQKYEVHAGFYDSSSVPEIADPTPLSLELFQHMYGPSGSWGDYMRNQGQEIGLQVDDSELVPIIAGRLYLDVFVLSQLQYKQSPYELLIENGHVQRRKKNGMFWFFHPILSLRSAVRNRLTVIKIMKQRRTHFEPLKDSENLDAQSIYTYILHTLGPVIFETSDLIQSTQNLLRKKLDQADDIELLLADISETGLLQASKSMKKKELLEAYWYASLNENELSGKRVNASNLQSVIQAQTKDAERVLEAREAASSRFISAWDKLYVKNMFQAYSRLNKERAKLHDELIKSMALLTKALQKKHTSDMMFYATFDELLSNDFPTKKELSARKKQWEEVRSAAQLSPNHVTRWEDIFSTPSSTADSFTGVSLSTGSAKGSIARSVEELDSNKSILLLESLSVEITKQFDHIEAIITERGGILAHNVIVAREKGIPVVRMESAKALLAKVDLVQIDAQDPRAVIAALSKSLK